jgi:hypothetical protein
MVVSALDVGEGHAFFLGRTRVSTMSSHMKTRTTIMATSESALAIAQLACSK